MATLLVLLLVIFVTLAIVVTVTEKFATPMAPELQSRLWRILVVLIFASLIIRLIQYSMDG